MSLSAYLSIHKTIPIYLHFLYIKLRISKYIRDDRFSTYLEIFQPPLRAINNIVIKNLNRPYHSNRTI